MADDAIDAWLRQLDGAPPPLPSPRRRLSLSAALVVPAALGIAMATAIVFTHGGPPSLSPVSPAYLGIPLLAFAAAVATRRETGEAVLWTLTACLAGLLAVAVIVPIGLVLGFVDCWLSWLSDC